MKLTTAQRKTKNALNRMIAAIGDTDLPEERKPKMEDIARGLAAFIEATHEAKTLKDGQQDMFSSFNQQEFVAYMGSPLQKRLL